MEHTFTQTVAALTTLGMFTVVSIFVVRWIGKTISRISYRKKYRKSLEKLELSKYIVFASENGMPVILQEKNNKNNLVYLW